MKITEVRLTKLEDSKALALASITIDTDFVVSGLAIYNGQNGMWVSMPSRKNKEGSDKKYSDICFPITKDAREQIQSAVLDKYNESVEPHFPQPTKNKEQKEYEIVGVKESDLPF